MPKRARSTKKSAQPNLAAQLTQLEAAQLVRRAQDEELDYVFEHALVQETAYAMLLKQDRRRLHRAIGEVLEQTDPDRLDENAALLAYHFGIAGEDAKTVAYAVRAGDAAMRVYAYPEARGLYDKALAALERLASTEYHRRLRADTLVKHVSISYPFQHSEKSFRCLLESESIIQDLYGLSHQNEDRLRLARIHYWMGRMHAYRNQTSEAIEQLMRTLQEAGDSGDEVLLAYPSAVIGRMMNIQGQFGAAIILLQQAVSPLEQSENWVEWIFTIGQLGLAQAARGEYTQGIQNGTRALQRALAINNIASVAEAHAILAAIFFMGADFERMAESARACIAAAEPTETRMYSFLAYAMLALAQSERGDSITALDSIQHATEIGKTMMERRAYSDWYAAAHAQVMLNTGQTIQACALARQAVELAKSVSGIFAVGLGERVWALALAQTDAPWQEIESHLANSAQAFEAGEARLPAAQTHAAWGRLLRARGKLDASRQHIEQAVAQYRESGLMRDLTVESEWISEEKAS